MNRRRSESPKSLLASFIALGLLTVIATSGGAMHAIFRNGQIKTERKISDARKRIDDLRNDIQMIQVRQERLMDRYEIRDQLAMLDSSLVPVTFEVVERIEDLPPEPMPVAVTP
ncbi:hypothetical protein HNR46_002184 [Haloferula luteola]|uniref:Septum formation initiator n=1 Tax=Haloferula luteola TaxID=595692 RepID=A0A840V1T0_9BACT|nr:hypothetical protein [Haloferula luteola]MBB5351945.1 hypothetical protein [Haloferula luteola]